MCGSAAPTRQSARTSCCSPASCRRRGALLRARGLRVSLSAHPRLPRPPGAPSLVPHLRQPPCGRQHPPVTSHLLSSDPSREEMTRSQVLRPPQVHATQPPVLGQLCLSGGKHRLVPGLLRMGAGIGEGAGRARKPASLATSP